MGEQARTDYRVLELCGYVQRELPREQAKRWRHALAGVAHEREHDARILTGYNGKAGIAWAVINDAPVDPGKAVWPASRSDRDSVGARR